MKYLSHWRALLMLAIAASATLTDLNPFAEPLDRETARAGQFDLDIPGVATRVGFVNSTLGFRVLWDTWVFPGLHVGYTDCLYM